MRQEKSLKDYIIRRGLKPGDALETENELAEILGVSRHHIRGESLELVQAGVLKKTPRRGTVIGEIGFEPLAEAFQFQLQLSGCDFRENWEARQLLELAILPLALKRITPARLTALERCVVEMERNLDRPETADRADFEFHRILLESCGNRTLEAFSVILGALFRDEYRVGARRPEPLAQAAAEHRGILEAVIAGDISLALERMRQHLAHPIETGGKL